MGAKLYIEAPELFVRDCKICNRYYYSRGELLKDSTGKSIERKENDKPKCNLCAKFDSSIGKVWDGFTPKNDYIFRTFLIAHYFRALPKPGGIDQQDPFIMDILIVLEEIFTKRKEIDNIELQTKLLTNIGTKYGI